MKHSTKNNRQKIIGRSREQKTLDDTYQSKKAEFLAIFGRRRVGKTFLIKTFFDKKDCIFFYCSGLQNGKLKEQLKEFSKQIGSVFYNGASIAPFHRWMDTFEEVTKAINSTPKGMKIVLFFDELPWMATKRSGLLEALDYYWNRYWSHNNNLKLIVCGSAASWIIEKIINNKGGLHNRVTRTMQLEPFSLHETQEFLSNSGVKLNQLQILDLYMALGGIPHYLALVPKGKTAHQAIDELCFQKNGELVNEFERLFSSLFSESPTYAALVKFISKYRYGIGQAQLIKAAKVSDGGSTIKKLKALEEAGFIQEFIPHGHQDKGKYYKVIDEFCLFYLYWIKPNLKTIQRQVRSAGYWLSKAKNPEWKTWSGYAFEAVCYKHIPEIRRALHIDVGAEIGSWRYAPRLENQVGSQIDLLFDRNDGAITLCEIKCNSQPYVIDKTYAKTLMTKIDNYQKIIRTQKQIFLAMITVAGLKPSIYSEEMVNAVVKLDDLFMT